MIKDTKWYLGGHCSLTGTASDFYGHERGTTVRGSTSGQTCSDGYCPRALDWTGKVALLYPSDFGFAVGSGDVRNTCLGLGLYYNTSGCRQTNYIRLSNYTLWFLSPGSDSAYNSYAIYDSNALNTRYTSYNYYVLPTVYLKSNVIITGGNGNKTNPFTLQLSS